MATKSPYTTTKLPDDCTREVLLSSCLDANIAYNPLPEVTVLKLDALSVTLFRLTDGEETQSLELNGQEMEKLIKEYRLQQRRVRKRAQTIIHQTVTSPGYPDDNPFSCLPT